LELEISNLAGRLTTRGTNEENVKLGHRGWEELRDLLLKFWDAIHISGTCEARNVKFGASMQNANTRDDR